MSALTTNEEASTISALPTTETIETTTTNNTTETTHTTDTTKKAPAVEIPQLSGEEWLAAQTRKVFDGVAALAASELKATSDEFQLLEQINRVASAKYAELSDTVESLENVSKELIVQRKSIHTTHMNYVQSSHATDNFFFDVFSLLLYFFFFTDTSLATHLNEIDAVDKSVSSLEQTIAALDIYTKELEAAANKAVADATLS